MKEGNNEDEKKQQKEQDLFLQRLREENTALNKLIKRLEERDTAKSKSAGKPKEDRD